MKSILSISIAAADVVVAAAGTEQTAGEAAGQAAVGILSVLIRIAVMVGITFLLLYLVRRIFRKFEEKRANLHLRFLKSVIDIIIVAVCAYICLCLFDVTRDISRTLLASGTLIVAVATFAAQQALGNVISGLSISLSKPCEIGQRINIIKDGTLIADGTVEDMTARHIVLRQLDGQTCIIPNSVVDASVIVNPEYLDKTGRIIALQIGYDSDIEKAREIIRKVCGSEPLLVGAQNIPVYVTDFAASGVELKFTVYAKSAVDSFTAASHIREKILREFRAAGIVIPYQTITLDQKAGKETNVK